MLIHLLRSMAPFTGNIEGIIYWNDLFIFSPHCHFCSDFFTHNQLGMPLEVFQKKKNLKFKIDTRVYREVENLNRVFKFVIEIFFRNGDRRIIGDRYDADNNQKYSIPADTSC